MKAKNSSSRQVRCAQDLSKYHFQIDYRESKANGTVNSLFCFPQRSIDEEEKFWAENTQIFHSL